MEQCGAVTAESSVTVAVGDVAISSVTEKHEIEIQEKVISCDDSVSDLYNEKCTELSVKSSKEDGELSSARCLFECLLAYVLKLDIVDSFVLLILCWLNSSFCGVSKCLDNRPLG